jgi:hypothetical protein
MSAILPNGEIKPRRPDCLADETVSGEPVWAANSLLSGKKQGISLNRWPLSRESARIWSQIPGVTEKFPAQRNREWFLPEQGSLTAEQGIYCRNQGIVLVQKSESEILQHGAGIIARPSPKNRRAFMTEASQDSRTSNRKRSAYSNRLPIGVHRSRRGSHPLPVAVHTAAHRAGEVAKRGTESGSP